MSKPESGVTRVTFEYNDEEYYLVGAELQKWLDFNTIVARHAHKDGVNPPWDDINWINAADDKLY